MHAHLPTGARAPDSAYPSHAAHTTRGTTTRKAAHGSMPATAGKRRPLRRSASPAPATPGLLLAPLPGQKSDAIVRLTGPLLIEQFQSIAQWDRQVLGYLYADVPIRDTPLLAHMAVRDLDIHHRPELLQINDEQLIAFLSTSSEELVHALARNLPKSRMPALVASPAIALSIVRTHPRWFASMPAQLKTVAVLKPLLDRMQPHHKGNLLEEIVKEAPLLMHELETLEQKITRRPGALSSLPARQITPQLCRLAVARRPHLMRRCGQHLTSKEYEVLCDLAVERSGAALGFIDRAWRTEARVDQALAHPRPVHIADIPPALQTRERLEKALHKDSFPSLYLSRPLTSELISRLGLWDLLKSKAHWLEYIRWEDRTPALCGEYVRLRSGRIRQVSLDCLQSLRPDWNKGLTQGNQYARLDEHNSPDLPDLDEDNDLEKDILCSAYSAFVNGNPHCLDHVPENLKTAMPPWALALAPVQDQMRSMKPEHRALILHNGGTEGLARALGAPACHIDPAALLDPMQEEHCSRRSAWLPGQVCIKLAFCHHFRLPRQVYGALLRRHLDQHSLTIAQQIASQAVPVCQPIADVDWTIRGGRTLVQEQDGCCLHLKFQRQGESLASFAAEEAVQRFAHTHRQQLGLRSEIPQPEGIFFVPQQDLPELAQQFDDPLQLRHDLTGPGYLVFCFRTQDSSYDTLAWHDDDQGGSQRARDGLMRAFHDLGVWSSLGAMHTSTIRLYHHFLDHKSRPELLLSAFFSGSKDYPGSLHLWNTRATSQSDWGWSGLRDLGDLEFYPFIKSYVESGEVEWTLPGYAQRASFVNAIAQNILGGLLHYMRLQRQQPGYYYRNEQAVSDLALFLQDGCDALLEGLLNKSVRLRRFFPDIATYEQWRQLTAREMIYWTARQNPQDNPDCFAQHLAENGRPSEVLYPGHPYMTCRYGEDFTEDEGETLGTDNGKFPLFYLVRGLYVMAAGLADTLARPAKKVAQQGLRSP